MKVSAISLASNPDISDEQIISRVLGGERDIYEVIVRRHNVKLYRVAKGILKDDEEIQDVMQEAYLKAFEKLYQFKGKSSFSTWLTRILINAAFARFNEKKKIHKTDIENVREENISVPAEQPIEPTIDSLPSTYRSVFMLREINGMSVADTAFCLDISEENVKVRLHRAKEMLKKVLRQGFGEIDLFEFMGERCDLFTEKLMKHLQ
jgi:RNA polymerase sigma factor (sigma-70 family)